MTQSKRMVSPWISRTFVGLFFAVSLHAGAQSESPELNLPASHPRLLLPARRLRLLKREVERQSERWRQLKNVLAAQSAVPEPGFAYALAFIIGGDENHGRQAVRWALGQSRDLRQLALVFDWCQPLLNPEESRRLAELLRTGIEKSRDSADLGAIRSRLMAAVALAYHVDNVAQTELKWIINQWWEGQVVPALKRGESPIPRAQTYALMEILHVVRDNAALDLRTSYKPYFATLPVYHLLTYYPAVYPASGSDFRIPVMENAGEPDLRDAALSRAAELSIVAYDPNALESQFLQGWCMQDQFLMRGSFGIPYEFLWANPYHPGLSYYNAPLVLHQPDRGVLVARSTWGEDSAWLYYHRGETQTFRDGEVKRLSWEEMTEPVAMANSILMPLRGRSRFQLVSEGPATYYLIGLDPNRKYDIEIDDEEVREVSSDIGGILVLELPAARSAGARLRLTPEARPPECVKNTCASGF